ncbi:hypothetical protein FA95DRAFT_228455 [Auriscalpium vulgare]|uniref:Uncharacterized protein n=1 Tax=Auriscalpium vulgare TaxID=40419 RepID=A0ACB8RK94_9AGAM|nr:hypothetical protein FA95DRAFT_228455 [Auriscalpium vulgare]
MCLRLIFPNSWSPRKCLADVRLVLHPQDLRPVIPYDIQAIVVDWVYRASQHSTVDYGTLRVCALVCRAWTPVAQRLLFRRIRVHDTRAADQNECLDQLLRTFRENPRLAAYVHTIEDIPLQPSKDQNDAILALLELCAHTVQRLSFDGWLLPPTWAAPLEQRLRALSLSPVYLDLSGAVSIVDRMAQIWPSARSLRISVGRDDDDFADFEIYDHMVAVPIQLSVPGTVRSLSVYAADPSWIFARDADLSGLRELEVDEESAGLYAQLRVSGVLAQLRFLDVNGHIPTQEALDQLVQLEILVFSLRPLREVSLPQSLRDLAYHRGDGRPRHRSSLACMLAVLRRSSNLRRFTMSRDLPRRMRVLFDEVCEDRGIEIITYEGYRPRVGVHFCAFPALAEQILATRRHRLDMKGPGGG